MSSSTSQHVRWPAPPGSCGSAHSANYVHSAKGVYLCHSRDTAPALYDVVALYGIPQLPGGVPLILRYVRYTALATNAISPATTDTAVSVVCSAWACGHGSVSVIPVYKRYHPCTYDTVILEHALVTGLGIGLDSWGVPLWAHPTRSPPAQAVTQ